jgi:predicted neutral ceramidase superfamily lipid hydrolase
MTDENKHELQEWDNSMDFETKVRIITDDLVYRFEQLVIENAELKKRVEELEQVVVDAQNSENWDIGAVEEPPQEEW